MATVAELYEYSKKILENPDSLDRDLTTAYYITQLIDHIAKIVYEQQKVDDSQWIREDNPNYSPFDTSSPYNYLCPVCEFKTDRPSDYCPACGHNMRPNKSFFKKGK